MRHSFGIAIWLCLEAPSSLVVYINGLHSAKPLMLEEWTLGLVGVVVVPGGFQVWWLQNAMLEEE